MRWLRRLIAIASALVVLVLLACGAAIWRLHHLVTTSPVREPERALLDRREDPRTAPESAPAWEQKARADQAGAFTPVYASAALLYLGLAACLGARSPGSARGGSSVAPRQPMRRLHPPSRPASRPLLQPC